MRKLFLSRSLEQVRLGGWIPTDRSLGAGVSDDSSIVPYLISIYAAFHQTSKLTRQRSKSNWPT